MYPLKTAAAFLLLLSFNSPPVYADPPPLKIGAILGLTGEWATWGERCRQAIEMAADEINAGSGRRLQLLFEDSTKATTALSAYHKLYTIESVRHIVGLFTAEEVEAVTPLSAADNVFVTTFVFTQRRPQKSLLVWIDPYYEADLLAAQMIRRFKRVAVLGSDQAWDQTISRAFAEAYRKCGGTITSLEEPALSTKDVRVPVIKTRAQQPEALFIPTYQVFPYYLREIARLRWHIPIFSVELDQALIDQSSEASEGVVFIRPAPAVADFIERYKQRFHNAPDLPAAQCYDALKLTADGIAHAGEDAAAMDRYFSALESFRGASGLISFKEGRTIMPTEWCTVRDKRVSGCRKDPP